MIEQFDPTATARPAARFRFQVIPAIGAGLIAGIVLLVVPRGSPWSDLSFFAPVILGREVLPETGMSLLATMVIHLALSIVYGLIVSSVVKNVTQLRALVAGGITALVLYVLNVTVVSLVAPQLRGNELPVAFTHGVFGMIAAGAYRGLLQRRSELASTDPL